MNTVRSDRGFTLIELLVVVAIIGTLASIGIMQVMRARVSANEASAIASLRAIVSAEQGYSQKCTGFAVVLTELSAAGGFLPSDLSSGATVTKSGYSMALAPGAGGIAIPAPPPGCTGPETGYYASAVPLQLGVSGSRAFATNAQGTIFFTMTATAPVEANFPTAIPIQ